jgi:DNA mismatch repair ATPase MutL
MPIAALPQETIRVLTSSVALNDAVSVVKELVDNALDASATAITIEISSNTIDIIQVKDNGRGIGIDDRQLLCKRGCTSKIRTIEDLTTLGGRSLGFRGEALASVVNTSDAVIITTRIEGEMVGTALKFGPNGKMLRLVPFCQF